MHTAHTCTRMHTCMRTHALMCTCTHMHTHALTCTHMHAHMHTCTHAHSHTRIAVIKGVAGGPGSDGYTCGLMVLMSHRDILVPKLIELYALVQLFTCQLYFSKLISEKQRGS